MQRFGEFAAEYDRYRPDYPAALWDDLLAEEMRRVVDLGCGTGRGILELARRGPLTIATARCVPISGKEATSRLWSAGSIFTSGAVTPMTSWG